jgi:hypothetical protein
VAFIDQQVVNDRQSGNPDDVLWVQFYKHPVKMDFKSEEEGRPIFEERVFIRIQAPGDTLNMTEREAWEGDYRRFPRQWMAFQAQDNTDGLTGTPVQEWSALNRAQVEELKALKFMTVEQLAGASDTQLQRIGMGGHGLRAKAQAYLAAAADTAVVQKQAAELQQRDAEIEDLKRQIAALAARMDEPEKRGPGRPKAA